MAYLYGEANTSRTCQGKIFFIMSYSGAVVYESYIEDYTKQVWRDKYSSQALKGG